jgi:amino acid transporter
LSQLDLFVQAVSIGQIGTTIVIFLETVGGFTPGANLYAVIAISGVIALAFAALWSIMAAALPRSGGDYVWISRIIPKVPAIGFMYAGTYGIIFMMSFIMGFQVWLFTNGILSPTFASLGLIYSNAAFTSLGNWTVAGTGLLVTGLILIAIAVITVSLGLRTGSKIMNFLFFYSLIVTIIWIIIGFTTSQQAFQQAFDSQFGSGQYANVLTLGKQAGFSGFTYDLFSTLGVGFSLGYLTLYANFQMPVWASGEIKKVGQLWKPYVLAVVAMGVFFALLIAALFNVFGTDWLGAVSAAAQNSATAGSLPFAPIPPTFTLFLSILFKDNPLLIFLFNTGLIAATCTWFIVPWIAFSRLIFSMSFDRVFPQSFADVTQKGRVPLKALSLIVVLVVIWFSQYVYGLLWNPNLLSFIVLFVTVSGVSTAAWTVAGLVFAFFPWLNKGLYERTMPPQFRKKIGLPIVTWLGLFVAITQAWATIAYVTVSAPYPVLAEEAIVVTMGGSFILYYVIAAIRKHQGINLKYVFNEVPPE